VLSEYFPLVIKKIDNSDQNEDNLEHQNERNWNSINDALNVTGNNLHPNRNVFKTGNTKSVA